MSSCRSSYGAVDLVMYTNLGTRKTSALGQSCQSPEDNKIIPLERFTKFENNSIDRRILSLMVRGSSFVPKATEGSDTHTEGYCDVNSTNHILVSCAFSSALQFLYRTQAARRELGVHPLNKRMLFQRFVCPREFSVARFSWSINTRSVCKD